MIASAFVGIGAMASSNDAVVIPGTGTINSNSGTVDYVPATVNITYNSEAVGDTPTETSVASFSPTVNWSNVPTGDSYSLTSTANVYTDSNCSTAYNNGSSFDITKTPTTVNGETIIGATSGPIVTITGHAATNLVATDLTLYIKVTSVLKYTTTTTNPDTTTTIDIASRTTVDTMSFTVHVYSLVTPTTIEGSDVNAIADPCYLGEAYTFDLERTIANVTGSDPEIKTGSGEYTFVTSDLNETGLYILGNSILGTAIYSEFTNNTQLTVNLTITDRVTGAVTNEKITIPMKLTSMTVTITEENSSVERDMTLLEGETGYVDQNSVITVKATFLNNDSNVVETMTITDVTTNEEKTITKTTDGYELTINATDGFTTLIGTNQYVINYTINGYSDSFKFYLEVIADGSAFIIVPDISIALTS